MRLPFAPAVAFPAAAVMAVVALIYGQTLTVGLLSDDFLYWRWSSESFKELLLHLTLDSYPRMLRPLPGLIWWVAARTGTPLWLHLCSLLLHGVNALLICTVLVRYKAPQSIGMLAASLFAAFPLFAEAVAWPSASFDLWATMLALAALAIAGRNGWVYAAGATAFYALSLLSKESVFFLPLVTILLLGRRSAKSSMGMAAVAVAYLAARFAILGGWGGYLDQTGESLAASVPVAPLARAVVLQLPYRLLVPLKDAGALGYPLLAVTGGLVAALFVSGRLSRRRNLLARALLAFAAALAPVAPIFGLEWYHEGSRLLYFPVAVALIGLGLAFERGRPSTGAAACILLVLWTAVSFANVRSWVEAGRRVRATSAAMAAVQERLPRNATVLVDALDSFKGAYVFRNGLPEAAALAGLRSDITWKRGTSAVVGPAAIERLGHDLFVVEPRLEGAIDRTACEADLWRHPPTPLQVWELGANGKAQPGYVLPPASHTSGRSLAALLIPESSASRQTAEGTIYWRDPEGAPFTISASQQFVVDPRRGATPVRLRAEEGEAGVQLRIDFDSPAEAPRLQVVALVPLPGSCRTARSALSVH